MRKHKHRQSKHKLQKNRQSNDGQEQRFHKHHHSRSLSKQHHQDRRCQMSRKSSKKNKRHRREFSAIQLENILDRFQNQELKMLGINDIRQEKLRLWTKFIGYLIFNSKDYYKQVFKNSVNLIKQASQKKPMDFIKIMFQEIFQKQDTLSDSFNYIQLDQRKEDLQLNQSSNQQHNQLSSNSISQSQDELIVEDQFIMLKNLYPQNFLGNVQFQIKQKCLAKCFCEGLKKDQNNKIASLQLNLNCLTELDKQIRSTEKYKQYFKKFDRDQELVENMFLEITKEQFLKPIQQIPKKMRMNLSVEGLNGKSSILKKILSGIFTSRKLCSNLRWNFQLQSYEQIKLLFSLKLQKVVKRNIASCIDELNMCGQGLTILTLEQFQLIFCEQFRQGYFINLNRINLAIKSEIFFDWLLNLIRQSSGTSLARVNVYIDQQSILESLKAKTFIKQFNEYLNAREINQKKIQLYVNEVCVSGENQFYQNQVNIQQKQPKQQK